MKMTILCAIVWYCHGLIAQDSILVVSRLSNSQFVTQNGITVISNLGYFPSGIYAQDSVIVNFEPFSVLFSISGPTAVKDLPQLEGLLVYPNPASRFVVLERGEANEALDIRIIDLQGSVLRQLTWEAGVQKMDLPMDNYAQSMYVLQVSDAKMTKASQFKLLRQ